MGKRTGHNEISITLRRTRLIESIKELKEANSSQKLIDDYERMLEDVEIQIGIEQEVSENIHNALYPKRSLKCQN